MLNYIRIAIRVIAMEMRNIAGALKQWCVERAWNARKELGEIHTADSTNLQPVLLSTQSKNTFMLIILGLLGIASGCFILLFHPYDLLFQWKATFSEGGEMFELWRKPEADVYLKVYLFNITNHEEYLDGRESKLRFQQVGPYVYKEVLEHSDVVFNDNGTLSTKSLHPLIYIPEMSNGTEEDLVIMPNIALFVSNKILFL
ncbi:scavenger receptor class B member 1-like isoform X2 [Nylanderia fulva]|uniref:scavenger receptor class B member 1-like isoform X2 n=1 Tax=Nylanderia fulva TaxID=613905 RepID=UPI0010FB125B|nr:scavenger receptor class B member 1-like isoform X2 [Nylanderia fulva]